MIKRTFEVGDEEIISTDSQLSLSEIKIQRKYMVDVAVFSEKKYVGSLVPIPEVLIKYLNSMELRVFSIILGQLKNGHSCMCRRAFIAKELGVSNVTISSVLTGLESMGLITQGYAGRRKSKTINFEAIQYLDKLFKDKLPGAIPAFRKIMGTQRVTNPSERALATLEFQYTVHNNEEDEEYDF